MKAVIKGFYSTDVEDLAGYTPSNETNFGFPLRLLISPEDEEGMESFDVFVCTPQWLLATHQREEIIIARHYLIVFEYNYEQIMQRIRSYVAECIGETWEEIALKLGRLGHWEFEDYQPY